MLGGSIWILYNIVVFVVSGNGGWIGSSRRRDIGKLEGRDVAVIGGMLENISAAALVLHVSASQWIMLN